MSEPRPVDEVSGYYRSLDAYPAEVGRAVRLAHRHHATEASTEAARHLVFERDVATDVIILTDDLRQGCEHGRRPATNDPCGPITALKSARPGCR